MTTRKKFSGHIKARREGALDRLKHPSAQLKERLKTFTPDQLKSHKARVEAEIATLETRIARG